MTLDLHPLCLTRSGYASDNIQLLILVDGNWTTWGNWGSCSRSCGLGHEMRQRFCVNPRPVAGGDPCAGSNKAFRPCNDIKCPGKILVSVRNKSKKSLWKRDI